VQKKEFIFKSVFFVVVLGTSVLLICAPVYAARLAPHAGQVPTSTPLQPLPLDVVPNLQNSVEAKPSEDTLATSSTANIEQSSYANNQARQHVSGPGLYSLTTRSQLAFWVLLVLVLGALTYFILARKKE